MATYSERLTAGSMTKHTMEGDVPVTGISATINGSCSRSGQGYGTGFAESITWLADISASVYKSSKKIKTKSYPFIYARSKTLSGTGQLASGSYEAIYSSNEGGPYVYLSSFLGTQEHRLSQLTPGYINLSTPIAIAEFGSTGQLYSNVNVSVNASLTVDGPSGTNKPYVDVVWEDVVPIVSGMAPSSGAFVDETKASKFNWTLGNVNAYDGTSLIGTSVFKWRFNGVVHTVSANATSVTIPAGTFPNGTIEWCVVHTTTDGKSNAENWQTITTVEATPDAPTNLSPRNEVVNGNEALVFSWRHNISTGSAQSKAELQKSDNGSAWTTLATVAGSAQSVTVPANTFTSGEKMWRVRTYNTDNTPGPYASASIIVKAIPQAPSIDSVTGVPLSTITWSATDQIGFRVVFSDAEGNDYDTGERYGATNTYTSPILLVEGEATATVYVANSSGLWNSTTIHFYVSNNAAGSITLDGNAERGKAILTWENNTTGSSFYILKNGRPIAKAYDTNYEDKAANGAIVYEIIALMPNGTYVRSNAITLDVRIMGAQVFDYEHGGELIELYVKRDSIFELSKSITANTSYYHFSGNTFPTAYSERHQNETISFAITKENTNLEAVLGLVGALCCIKDKTGAVAFGVLDSIGEGTDRYTDLTLSFTRTEDEEGVAYEA